ncbi:MAG: TetR/AcrR family transcriptional regulator [Parvibaculum sp.]|nr:TetR/AcrR family transcriptional regulator [Parvibaculum sp.]
MRAKKPEKIPPGPRKAPKQARARATVEAIVEAAARILIEDGVEAFTTNRVAMRAGASVGSLYQYFPNKQALIRSLMERELRRGEALRPALLDDPATSLDDGIAAAVDWHLAAHGDDPDLRRALDVLAEDAVTPREWRRYAEWHESGVARFLVRHSAEIRVGDVKIAGFLVSQTLRAAAEAASLRRREALEDGRLARELTRMILGYLRG